jgi:hypothetical protein
MELMMKKKEIILFIIIIIIFNLNSTPTAHPLLSPKSKEIRRSLLYPPGMDIPRTPRFA